MPDFWDVLADPEGNESASYDQRPRWWANALKLGRLRPAMSTEAAAF
jgi:hypothetical protein